MGKVIKHYVREEVLNQPADFVDFLMKDYLRKNGYQYVKRKGEMVWKSGDGFFTMIRCIQYGYSNGKVHIEAWVSDGFRDMDLEGFVAAVPKGMFKKDIEQIITLLHQTIPNQQMQLEQPYYDMNGNLVVPQTQPIQVKTVDMSKQAMLGFWFSIASVVLTLLLCLLDRVTGWALILSICAIINGKKGMKSQKYGFALSGFIIGIIMTVVVIALWMFAIIGAVVR